MIGPRPVIRVALISQAAIETMDALNRRYVIFQDQGELFELTNIFSRSDFKIRRIELLRLVVLMECADFEKFDARTAAGWKRIDPPMKVARLILKMQDQWPFKRLQTPEPMNEAARLLR